MKTLYAGLILIFLSPAVWCQSFEMGTTLTLSQPVNAMSGDMNNAFGLSLAMERKFKNPFSAGLELGFGNYGYQTTRQQYTFDDGSVTETNVNVSNNLFSLSLTGKHFLRPEKKVNPYLSGKAGWTWFTTQLIIEDPADEYSCHPVESDILSRDNTYLVSGGAGLRVDFQALSPNARSQRLFLDVSVHATHGGIINYMNVKKHHTPSATPDRDVMVKFINTQTQVVHEHHVGFVYSSVLNMVEYRLGVIFRPSCQ